VASGQQLHTLDAHSHAVRVAVFSPDGSRLVSGSIDQSIRIWDTNTWECLCTLTDHLHYVFALGFTNDGTRLCSGSFAGELRVWDAVAARERFGR
jgi:WD40 repeat protein